MPTVNNGGRFVLGTRPSGSSPGGATQSAASDHPVAALSLVAAPRPFQKGELGSGSGAGAA
jgi:hypothetical protein